MDHNGIINDLIGALPRSEGRILDVSAQWVRDGHLQQANDLLKQALHQHSTPSLKVAFARVLLATGKAKSAMGDMVVILKDDPNHTDALLVLTQCLIECAEYERAQRMLDRATKVGGPPSIISHLQSKLDALTGSTGQIPSSLIEEKLDNRRSTMMGGPNVSPFDVADPLGGNGAIMDDVTVDDPTVESGTFTDLESYMIMPDDDETVMELSLEKLQTDAQFDNMLQGMGVNTGPPPADRTTEHIPESARPDDPTMGLVIKDREFGQEQMTPTASGLITSAPKFDSHTAAPEEPTSAITIADGPDGPVIQNSRGTEDATEHVKFNDKFGGEQQFQEMPSVEYDPGYLNEASDAADNVHSPPDDLDQLPSFDATISGSRSSTPNDPPLNFDSPSPAWNSKPAPVDPVSQPAGNWQPSQPSQPARPQKPVEISALSPDRSVPEPTIASGSRPVKKSGARIPLIVGIVICVLAVGMLSLTAISASQHTSKLAQAKIDASAAYSSDTYEGYLAAYNQVNEALSAHSFLGAGFDKTIHPMLPFESMKSDTQKNVLYAERAFIAAVIEARFEETETKTAKEHVALAMELASDQPETAAAAALVNIAVGKPQEALAIITGAEAKFSGSALLAEVKLMVLAALDKPKDAKATAEKLAQIENPTVRQRFLIAYADRLNNNRDGLSQFSDILAQTPEHVDSIIERSYLLREGASEFARAEKELTELPRSASQYQQAKAAVALGDMLLGNKKESDAEEKFRDAIRRMPSRTELYEPLLDYYFSRGRYDDAKTFIEKAEKEGRQSSALSIRHGELLVLTSEPLKALDVLNGTDFNDPRKDWFKGLAYLFLKKYPEATEAFANGEKNAGLDFPGPAAFTQLARATQDEVNIEDAIHQIGLLKEKHPEDENVRWALAKTLMKDAERTSSRTKRNELLGKAKTELEKASKIRPEFPVFQYDLCELHLMRLDEKRAEAACKKGRRMTKDYVPGSVILAKLRLSQGNFKQAYDDLKPIADRRPNDSEIGLLLARSAIEQRRIDEARKQLDKWVGKEGVDEFTMQLLEGRTQFAQEAYTRAIGYLERAHELRPENGEASALYAHALTRLGKHKSALKIVKAASNDPIWGGYAQLVTGEINRRRNKIRTAGTAYAKAERWFKRKPVPTYQIAVLYTEMALAASARVGWTAPEVKDLFTEARAKGDVSDPYLNFNLALFHLNQKKPDTSEAIKAFERVADAIPNNCPANDALIKLYDQKKRKKKKRAAQKRFDEHCK